MGYFEKITWVHLLIAVVFGFLLPVIHYKRKEAKQRKLDKEKKTSLVELAKLQLGQQRGVLIGKATDDATDVFIKRMISQWNFSQCKHINSNHPQHQALLGDPSGLLAECDFVVTVEYSQQIIRKPIYSSEITPEFLAWMIEQKTPIQNLGTYYRFGEESAGLRARYKRTTGREAEAKIETGVEVDHVIECRCTINSLVGSDVVSTSSTGRLSLEGAEAELSKKASDLADVITQQIFELFLSDAKQQQEGSVARLIPTLGMALKALP